MGFGGQSVEEGFDMRGSSPEDPPALAASPPSADEVLVSIVVPTYREADNLPLLVPQITAALEILVARDHHRRRQQQRRY